VKRYGKYGWKLGWIVKRYRNYERIVSRIVKIWNLCNKNKLNSEKILKIWKKSKVELWKDMEIIEEK
jgi:reverse gyrase